MYKYIYSIIVILICLSCDNEKTGNAKHKKNPSYQYYLKSYDKKRLRKQRLKLINKAFNLDEEKDSIWLKILARKSKLHYSLKQYDSSEFYDRLLLQESKRLKDCTHQGIAYFNIADAFKRKGISDSAFKYYNQSRVNYIKANDSFEVGKKLLTMASIQERFGDYHGSQERVVEGLRYLKNSENQEYLAKLYNTAGTNYRKLGILKKAIKAYEDAIKTAKDTVDVIKFKNNLAATQIDNKAYQKAINILQEIKKDLTLIKIDDKERFRINENLLYALWKQHPQISNVKDLEEILENRKKENDYRGMISSYTRLAECYLYYNENANAKQYIEEGIETAKYTSNPRGELDLLNLKRKVYPKDIKVLSRIIFLGDSLGEEERAIKNHFALIKHYSKEAEDLYRNERKKNEQLEADQVKNNLRKKVSILTIVLIIILALLIILYLYKNHQIARRTIAYTTEKRISKRLHDELANDVYNVMISLQKQILDKTNDPKEELLDRMESIYKRTRDISKENNAIDTGVNYIAEIKEMLSNYATTHTNVIVKGIEKPEWNKIEAHKKIIAYRILQELMVNMKKHSNAELVVITFDVIAGYVKIRYVDNGEGCDFFVLKNGNGWQNVENRIESIKGKITFDSEPRKGMKIEITFPV
ncbi:tetratricopeptide repeat-containing sensor histidine kinase [Aquimarina rhabdastrellae]